MNKVVFRWPNHVHIDLNSSKVINCPDDLFSAFSIRSFWWQLQNYLHSRGVPSSLAILQKPQGNLQIEQNIWRTIFLAQIKIIWCIWIRNFNPRSTSLDPFCVRHEPFQKRVFKHNRRSSTDFSLSSWLLPLNNLLMKKHRPMSQYNPLAEKVEHTIDKNPHRARMYNILLKNLGNTGGTILDPDPPIPSAYEPN